MPCGWEGNRRSYVVIVTASGFNIVAMVCCEAYAFSERSGSRHHAVATVGVTSVRHWRQRHHVTTVGVTSVGRWGRRHHVITVGVTSSNTGGSIGCAIFGVLMVYIGSVIVHLGPTIIGGDFNCESSMFFARCQRPLTETSTITTSSETASSSTERSRYSRPRVTRLCGPEMSEGMGFPTR